MLKLFRAIFIGLFYDGVKQFFFEKNGSFLCFNIICDTQDDFSREEIGLC